MHPKFYTSEKIVKKVFLKFVVMKPVTKMGVIALISLCVVFYQYHLSIGVGVDQQTSYNAPGAIEDTENISASLTANTYYEPSKITEDMIRSAVVSVQEANGLSPDVASQLINELLHQFKFLSDSNNKNSGNFRRIAAESKLIQMITTTVASSTDNIQREYSYSKLNVPPLYIITPTYRRPEQIPELTRLSHTLMLVKNVHWLVIEDANMPTRQVTELLKKTGIKYEHLIAPMPDKYKQKKGAKPRGVSNRNRGLQWVRANATDGVVYFADDDNTYDIELFDEIRKTKKVSMFPVGLCTKFGLSSPILKNGKFDNRFYDGWIAGRKYPVDMAGFAVSVNFLKQRPDAVMPFKAGYEEDGFLRNLEPFQPSEIELLADNCSKVLAWHTQTKKNDPSAPLDMQKYSDTNLVKLKQQIV